MYILWGKLVASECHSRIDSMLSIFRVGVDIAINQIVVCLLGSVEVV